jgi:uncharacterized protein YdiU (UPF0061 family)
MLGIYDPRTVYSSIDVNGRYAFGSQPDILQWNMARFAECLLPLIDKNTANATERIKPVIASLPHRFEEDFLKMMGKKLGMASIDQDDRELIADILSLLENRRLDYTVTFDLLARSFTSEQAASRASRDLGDGFVRWKKRVSEGQTPPEDVRRLARRNNPVVIPRNHHVENVLRECDQTDNAAPAEKFLQVLLSPYKERPDTHEYQDPPGDGDIDYKTFCGT